MSQETTHVSLSESNKSFLTEYNLLLKIEHQI